jgi:hypothetical protein
MKEITEAHFNNTCISVTLYFISNATDDDLSRLNDAVVQYNHTDTVVGIFYC